MWGSGVKKGYAFEEFVTLKASSCLWPVELPRGYQLSLVV